MNTHTHTLTFVALAAMAVTLTIAIAPAFMNSASAKISSVVIEERCENPQGKEAGGQQPQCKGQAQEQITVTENQNPSGKAPPGQNP